MIKSLIKKTANIFGYSITNIDPVIQKDRSFISIYNQCKNYTMTSKEKMYALYKAVDYIVDANIPGDFVECGVWKGGSAMMMALTLIKKKVTNRKIYLYDTFSGMPQPTHKDSRISNNTINAENIWAKKQKKRLNAWCYAPLSEVKQNMTTTKYPVNNTIFVKGKVENTIPKTIPSKIALLRLDTDWYKSTKHELDHLYPILVKKGALIADDYGYWTGSKQAIDEYFFENRILLTRIDDSGRLGIKIE